MKMNEFRLIKISRKFVATFRINNIPALVQIYISGSTKLSAVSAPRTVVTPCNQVTTTPSSSGHDDFASQPDSVEYGFH